MNFNEILHGDGNMVVISWLQGMESKEEEDRKKERNREPKYKCDNRTNGGTNERMNEL